MLASLTQHVFSDLTGFYEVLDAGGVVLGAGEVQRRPPVVVAHVHVHPGQVGPLQRHLVALGEMIHNF